MVVEQIHDHPDTREQRMNVARLMVDGKQLENDSADPDGGHARSITQPPFGFKPLHCFVTNP